MYYEEKIINGILHHRGSPDGEWIMFTIEDLSMRSITRGKSFSLLESQLTQLKADNAKLREGLEECLMAFQAEELLLDEIRVQALLEQTKEATDD